MKYFAYKIKNSNDRDCVAYIDTEEYKNQITNYPVGVEGSCYSCQIDTHIKTGSHIESIDYSKIETILTEDEYNKLLNPNGTDLTCIMEKLESKENQKFFENVIQEEIEYLKYEFYLSDKDIEEIFMYYSLDYKDRSIISAIYDSVEDLAVEIVEEFYNIPDILKNYIDYNSFGEDELLKNEEYIELSDDRVVRLNC